MGAGRWTLWLGLLASVGLLGACRKVPLYGNPMLGDRTAGAPRSLFAVDWWAPLVDAPQLEYAPREMASPAVNVDTGRVVVLTRDGHVRSLTADGQLEWTFRTDKPFNAGALLHERSVFVPGGDGVLYALDGATGELRWKYAAGEELASTPVVDGERVMVASARDALYVLEHSSGKWLWQYRRDPPSGFTIRGVSTPVVRDGTVYLGFSDGHLVALDAADGTVRWQRNLSTAGSAFLDVDTTPVLDESGRLYVASYKEGLYALDAASGAVVYRRPEPGLTSLVAAGAVLFGAGDGRLAAFRAEDGRALWSLPMEDRAVQRPVFAGGLVIAPTQKALVFVDPEQGRRRLTWNPGDGVSATPRFVGGHLYVLSNLGYLYAMRLERGAER